MTTPKTVEEAVEIFEEWMDKEANETGGEIGQLDLSEKFEELCTSLLEGIVEEIEGSRILPDATLEDNAEILGELIRVHNTNVVKDSDIQIIKKRMNK